MPEVCLLIHSLTETVIIEQLVYAGYYSRSRGSSSEVKSDSFSVSYSPVGKMDVTFFTSRDQTYNFKFDDDKGNISEGVIMELKSER